MLRDTLRREEQARFAALTPEERREECLRAGRLQVELYARAHGIPFDEAEQILERNKQIGRTPCSFLERDAG
ncbi:MAG: hypothetical protein R3F61_10065 [Myxococcota bacterium]